MKADDIARIAYEINRAYCASLGDDSQVPWEDAEDWQKESTLAGVAMHLANPDATPEQSHEAWLQHKLADGWTYGETKDPEKKLHPCCVPYDELPQEQKSKDYLFKAVVAVLKDIPDVDEAVADAVAKVVASYSAAPGAAVTIPVQYIGRREFWRDTVYRSGLTFAKDQVRSVPPDIAKKLLRHSDLFCKAEVAPEQDDTAEQLEQGDDQAKKEEQRRRDFDVIDQVNQMDKQALVEFAEQRFQLKLDKRMSVANMRREVASYVERFGAL